MRLVKYKTKIKNKRHWREWFMVYRVNSLLLTNAAGTSNALSLL